MTTDPRQENRSNGKKNSPEVQPPPVPNRNLPEHEVQADKEGPRVYTADPKTSAKTLELEAPKVNEEAAP